MRVRVCRSKVDAIDASSTTSTVRAVGCPGGLLVCGQLRESVLAGAAIWPTCLWCRRWRSRVQRRRARTAPNPTTRNPAFSQMRAAAPRVVVFPAPAGAVSTTRKSPPVVSFVTAAR